MFKLIKLTILILSVFCFLRAGYSSQNEITHDEYGNAIMLSDPSLKHSQVSNTSAVTDIHAPLPEPMEEPPYQDGFPIPTPGSGNAAVVGDIDGNGDMEIVWTTSDEDIDFVYHIFVVNHDGTSFPGWPKSEAEPGVSLYRLNSSPSLADLDNDGDLEIVVANATWGDTGNKTYAWHHEGTLVDGFPLSDGWPSTAHAHNWTSPAITDLEGDGFLEIATSIWKSFPAPAVDTAFYYLYNYDGTLKQGWPYGSPNNIPGLDYHLTLSPAIADFDGDSDNEFIFATRNTRTIVSLESDGQLMNGGWPYYWDQNQTYMKEISLADMTNDGDIELIVSPSGRDIVQLNYDGSLDVSFPLPFTMSIIARGPVVGDIDGDRDCEIATGIVDEPGMMFAWDHEGTLLPDWPVYLNRPIYGMPAIADIDDDGMGEIICGCYDGHLYAWNNDATLVDGFPILIAPDINRSGTMGAPCITDLDGDGDVEVLVLNVENLYYQDETFLYCWDLPAAYNVRDTDWPMHRHDIWSTGALMTQIPTHVEDTKNLPDEFRMITNYPNPFNESTTISFKLQTTSEVSIGIYNLLGQKIETLLEGQQQAGKHSVSWDASKFSSGIYFYKLSVDEKSFTKRMMLLK
ncbi:MAG: T9SS type A sorting domain-containing protein, partial [candidate division Zixibacteria bacterium]|nr:T9SS type A sorting domain-containing protein [candidate division Zixibacteria bacterium]